MELQVPPFPLPRCVMLPSALIPLHVFERRYRAMMAFVLAQPPGERYIGRPG